MTDHVVCATCRSSLSPAARFCHRCGAAVEATAPTTVRSAPAGGAVLPWAFAGIVLLSFGAYVAAQQFQAQRAPQASASAAAPAAAAPPGALPGSGADAGFPRAPDISQLSPEEAADRLFNRIMTEYEAGNSEFVQNMAPMALAAYERIPTMDPLRRYDLGRIAEITGALALARAQADSILAAEPNHLLGLILAARVADLERDESRRAALAGRLLDVAPSELERDRMEYVAHRNDINIALTEARRRRP